MSAVSSEEAVVRGVLARAFLNILRFDRTDVGVVLDLQADARRALDHLETVARSLGIEPFVRRTNGREEFHIDRDHRIMLYSRRTANYAIRGYSLDALYIPADWMTPEREENILPALITRAGNIERY